MANFTFNDNTFEGTTQIAETIINLSGRHPADVPGARAQILRDAVDRGLSPQEVDELLDLRTPAPLTEVSERTRSAFIRLREIVVGLGEAVRTYPGLVLLMEHVRRLIL